MNMSVKKQMTLINKIPGHRRY